MQVPGLLLQTVFVPIISAVVFILTGRKIGKRTGWFACSVLIYTTLLLLLEGKILWTGTNSIEEQYTLFTFALNLKLFHFVADGLSLPVALIMNIVCLTCAVFSVNYIEHRIKTLYGEKNHGMYSIYYSIFMFFPAGLIGIAFSSNLIELYVFVELVLVPAFLMINLFGYDERSRAGIMYFIWSHLGASLFLVGAVLAFANSGSFEVTALGKLTSTSIAYWVGFFILIGWLIKMAVFGFHSWIRCVYGHTPTSIVPIMTAILGLGNYVIVRLLIQQLPYVFKIFSFPVMIWAITTMIYGALLTISQEDIILLYACSTINQTAYSLLGISSLTSFGISGGIFYFLSHSLGKCILFLVAGIILTQTGLRDISKMGGLAHRIPFTATLCILGSMILSAIPPLSGFQAEWIMFTGIFQYGIQNSLTLALTLVAFFTTFFSIVYTFWPIMRIFFGNLTQSLEKVKEAQLSMIAPLFILAFISLLIGIFPNIIMHFLMLSL